MPYTLTTCANAFFFSVRPCYPDSMTRFLHTCGMFQYVAYAMKFFFQTDVGMTAMRGGVARHRSAYGGLALRLHEVEQLLFGVDPELVVDAPHMGAHGVLGDGERLGRVGDAPPAGDEGEHVGLAP